MYDEFGFLEGCLNNINLKQIELIWLSLGVVWDSSIMMGHWVNNISSICSLRLAYPFKLFLALEFVVYIHTFGSNSRHRVAKDCIQFESTDLVFIHYIITCGTFL